MDFIGNLNLLLNEHGVKKSKLLSDLKIGKNQFKYWEDKGNLPNGETLIKIAEYFNVTIDYLLLGKEQTQSPLMKFDLTTDELKLINYFRELDPIDQDSFIGDLAKAVKSKADEKAGMEAGADFCDYDIVSKTRIE